MLAQPAACAGFLNDMRPSGTIQNNRLAGKRAFLKTVITIHPLPGMAKFDVDDGGPHLDMAPGDRLN